MNFLICLLVSALAVFVSAKLLPGVHVNSFVTALIVAMVLGVINAVLKPILVILTLPINLLTLGLFTFIINGALVLLVSSLITGFVVDGLLWAIIFSIVLTIISSMLHAIIK